MISDCNVIMIKTRRSYGTLIGPKRSVVMRKKTAPHVAFRVARVTRSHSSSDTVRTSVEEIAAVWLVFLSINLLRLKRPNLLSLKTSGSEFVIRFSSARVREA